jgi:signal transduction histidine kinase
MKSWPLRRKLTLWSALVTGVALLTLGAATALSLYFEQIEFIDRRLKASADPFFSELPLRGPAPWENTDFAPLLLKGTGPLRGFAIGQTAGSLDHAYPQELTPLVQKWPLTKGYGTEKLGKRRLRLGVFEKDGRSLVLVADLHAVDEMVWDLFVAYLFALPVVLIVVAVGSSWFARRALNPVAQITRAAEAITAERLDARLPVPLADDEIGRLTHVLNAMFDRLQRGFEQATRFTADASHELRTPLTILRGEIEEALRAGKFDPAQEKLLVDLLEQTSGLQKIADNLLLLARFDVGKAPVMHEPVDFSLLVREAAEDAELLASPERISIHAEVQPGVWVCGDAHLLRRVMLNLIDNAVRYNREGGEVSLALRCEPETVVVVVANTGAGIPADRRADLFQRFFRLNADRNRGTGGSGLGLSLCREIVVAHGGRIELGRSDADRTEFIVRLPLETTPTAS